MYWILGVISALGILSGVWMFLRFSRVGGIMRVILSLACPAVTVWFCSLKEARVYGGTDWEFLLHAATVDGDFCPWLLLFLLITEVVLIVAAGFRLLASRTVR